jgi:hypothetical protein
MSSVISRTAHVGYRPCGVSGYLGRNLDGLFVGGLARNGVACFFHEQRRRGY